MNYYRDLLPESKVSGPKLTMGALCLFNALLIPDLSIFTVKGTNVFGWLTHGVWLIGAIYWIMDGLGYRLWRVPGKAYVRIDDEMIALKPNLQSKETIVRWNDVSGILYSAEKYTMRTREGGAVFFGLTTLDYSVIQEVKANLDQLAVEKQINIARQTPNR